MSCEIFSDAQKNQLIRAYLPPYTFDHLLDLEEDLNRFPGIKPIVMGDLNSDISRLQNPQSQHVADLLASFVLVDLLEHFRKWMRFCHMKMWWQAPTRKNVAFKMQLRPWVGPSDI